LLAILLAAQTEKQSRLWGKYPRRGASLLTATASCHGTAVQSEIEDRHVLFIEIAGYSKLLINQQSEQLCSYLRSRQKNGLEKVALSQ